MIRLARLHEVTEDTKDTEMSNMIRCAHCKETIEDEPVVKLGVSYCSAACAFEATERPKPKQCGVPVEESAKGASADR
jgi:hypothetical protein